MTCDRRGAGSVRRTSARSTTCCRPASRASSPQLHHVPIGALWTPEEIAKRQAEIGRRPDGSASGLAWEVVESVPPSEDIKKQIGDWRAHLDTYRASLRNLAAAGIEVVCYNFMPVLDWTRTDVAWRAAERRHLHALRLDRLRGLRRPHPRPPRCRRGIFRGACARRPPSASPRMDDKAKQAPDRQPRLRPARRRRQPDARRHPRASRAIPGDAGRDAARST